MAELAAMTPQQQARDITTAIANLGETVLAWQSRLPINERHSRLLEPYTRCSFLCVQCGSEQAIGMLMDPAADLDALDQAVAAAAIAVDVYGADEHVAAAIEDLRALAFHRRSLVATVQWLHQSGSTPAAG